MGVLIEGQWRDQELPTETGQSGEFQRAESRFRDRITADGSSGFKAEAGRTISTCRIIAPGRIAL
jgi:putative glutathione S-transferase